MLALPLYLQDPARFHACFGTVVSSAPSGGAWPSPVGLSLGLASVAVGQVVTLIYFFARHFGLLGPLVPVQSTPLAPFNTWQALRSHLAQPEGFAVLGGYLTVSWMMGWMPASYYSFAGGINWMHVAAQLLIQDAIQYVMHRIEHVVTSLYPVAHKPHHRFVNPKLFDAFNGSLLDTLLMIILPLAITAQLVHCNVWSYMVFGTLYANWLTLLHSEHGHVWDPLFQALGLGSAADHHVHHRLFVYNYGHLFMYWDMLGGTYKNPREVPLFTMFKRSALTDFVDTFS